MKEIYNSIIKDNSNKDTFSMKRKLSFEIKEKKLKKLSFNFLFVLLKLHSREAFYLHIAYNLEAIQVHTFFSRSNRLRLRNP